MSAALVSAPTTSHTARPWAFLDARHLDDQAREEVVVRVAEDREDAEAARALLRDAWGVSADERYFYRLFEDAQMLFDAVIAPSQRSANPRELEAICFMIEARDSSGELVSAGTFSFVLDHGAKTIELGRGAICQAWQRRKLPSLAIAPMRRFLDLLPDYAVIVDATTLARGAKTAAEALGCPCVALHPSSFTVQPDAVAGWQRKLGAARGPVLAEALLHRSDRTGLGRFMTSFHARPPVDLDPKMPVLSASQQPFFAYTCEVLGLDPARAVASLQSVSRREPQRHDNIGTATQTLVDPSPSLDVGAWLRDSRAAGFETVIVQVPCDSQHLGLGAELEAHGGILSGVFVDAHGDWRASYTLLCGRAHDAAVRVGLATLVADLAFDERTMGLLRLVHAHAHAHAQAQAQPTEVAA